MKGSENPISSSDHSEKAFPQPFSTIVNKIQQITVVVDEIEAPEEIQVEKKDVRRKKNSENKNSVDEDYMLWQIFDGQSEGIYQEMITNETRNPLLGSFGNKKVQCQWKTVQNSRKSLSSF